MLRALPAAFTLILAIPAHAGPALSPGRQATPPGPGPATPRPIEANFDQRRAIRGCPVERDCHAELMHGLREFEVQNFGSGSNAWVKDATRRPSGAKRKGKRKNSRAHLPAWMQKLKLPDVPVRWDSRVVKYLEFYKNDPRGRRIMAAWLRAQGRYRDLMLPRIRRAKLPDALLYISMIESSYDATEYSRSGASGLWQFMPAGGRIYGLAISRWIE